MDESADEKVIRYVSTLLLTIEGKDLGDDERANERADGVESNHSTTA